MIVVFIILLNMLIALMSATYQRVQEHSDVEATLQLARAIVDIERTFMRARHWRERRFFPNFLYSLEAQDANLSNKKTSEWEELERNLQSLETSVSRQSERTVESMQVYRNSVENRIRSLEGKLDRILENLESGSRSSEGGV
jgi:DNA anti-recombination protein RmuC